MSAESTRGLAALLQDKDIGSHKGSTQATRQKAASPTSTTETG